jgi:hypothetical protein
MILKNRAHVLSIIGIFLSIQSSQPSRSYSLSSLCFLSCNRPCALNFLPTHQHRFLLDINTFSIKFCPPLKSLSSPPRSHLPFPNPAFRLNLVLVRKKEIYRQRPQFLLSSFPSTIHNPKLKPPPSPSPFLFPSKSLRDHSSSAPSLIVLNSISQNEN